MRKLRILLLIICCFNLIFAKELNFYKEIITITIFGDYCELEGDYYFRNTDSISTILVYPFVINDSLNFPDSIKIYDKNNMLIDYETSETAAIFPFKKSDFFKGYY